MQMTKYQEGTRLKRKEKEKTRKVFRTSGSYPHYGLHACPVELAFSSKIEVGVIKSDTIEVKAPLKGVFVRKEQLLSSPGAGILIPSISYGEKVGVNQEVATLVDKQMRDVVKNYRQMELELLKRVIKEYESSSATEKKVWEEAIEKQLDKLVDYSNSGDLSNVASVRSSMDRILEARADTILENIGSISKYKSEKEELERLKNSQAKSVQSIKAPASGVVSYHCDGYEDWTPDDIYNITIDDIDKVLNAETSSENWITPTELEVEAGECYGKLVVNDKAWLVFSLPEDTAESLKVQAEKSEMNGDKLELEVELDGLSSRIPVTIEGFGEGNADRRIVVASLASYIELTMDMRGVTGNLILQSVTGMKVPVESLFNVNSVDGTADIIVIEMNKARYRRVRILAEQDNYAIIENLDNAAEDGLVDLYDLYIVDPRNIEEGQVIDI